MKERSLAAWFKEQALPWIVGLGFLAIVLGFIIGLASCTTTQKLPDPDISPSPVPSFSPAPSGKVRLPSMQTYLTYYGSWNQTSLVLKVEGDRSITIDIYEDPRDRDTLHGNISAESEAQPKKKTQH